MNYIPDACAGRNIRDGSFGKELVATLKTAYTSILQAPDCQFPRAVSDIILLFVGNLVMLEVKAHENHVRSFSDLHQQFPRFDEDYLTAYSTFYISLGCDDIDIGRALRVEYMRRDARHAHYIPPITPVETRRYRDSPPRSPRWAPLYYKDTGEVYFSAYERTPESDWSCHPSWPPKW
jgi:hypothetical protein